MAQTYTGLAIWRNNDQTQAPIIIAVRDEEFADCQRQLRREHSILANRGFPSAREAMLETEKEVNRRAMRGIKL